jgi:MFS family permease
MERTAGRRDRHRLTAAAFLRALATAAVGVLLGVYLPRQGLSAAEIGLVSSAGLGGAAVAALAVSWRGDRWGRRATLRWLAVASALGMTALAAAPGPGLMAAAAFLGMVNAMGRDRGAAQALEQAALPATTDDRGRTRVFACYTALQDAAHALGSLLAGLPALAAAALGAPAVAGERVGLLVLPLLGLAGLGLYAGLSPAAEAGRAQAGARLSPASRRNLGRLSALFAIDGIGGGLLVTSLLSFYFFERFGAPAPLVAALFFGARVANVLSHFAAARLARRIGLVNTMVFTHIPSSLLLVGVAAAPSLPVAAALFLLRECLVEMDVPTRQSYVMAVVAPGERTVAAGVTNLVRLGAWGVGPVVAGAVMEHVALATPLFLAAGLKIAYDVALFAAFRKVKPPEEK